MRLMRGVPVGRAATIELRNQHMTYAVTWYAPPPSLIFRIPVLMTRFEQKQVRFITGDFGHVI